MADSALSYRKTEDGWIIAGLTQEGTQQERLILPTSHDSFPITGMDAAVLQNHTMLKELTIQPNISVLWDGFAQGCTHLRRIILTGEEPSAYSVGDGLMDGPAS